MPAANAVQQTKGQNVNVDNSASKMYDNGSNSQQKQWMMNFGGYSLPPSYPFMFPLDNFFRPNGGRGQNNRPRGQAPSSIRHLCQLCGKLGHLISRSWYRFNRNFQASTNESNSSTNTFTQPNNSPNPNPSSLPKSDNYSSRSNINN